jgi:hypothetical protein
MSARPEISRHQPGPPRTSDLGHSAEVLRQTLADVERDEAEAISTLCALLEWVETSRNFNGLAPIRDVVKQWQNLPPRGIVTHLIRIGETLKCQGRDHT